MWSITGTTTSADMDEIISTTENLEYSFTITSRYSPDGKVLQKNALMRSSRPGGPRAVNLDVVKKENHQNPSKMS